MKKLFFFLFLIFLGCDFEQDYCAINKDFNEACKIASKRGENIKVCKGERCYGMTFEIYHNCCLNSDTYWAFTGNNKK